MPSLTEWPREIRRGPLRGQTFASQAEYDEARARVVDESPDEPPATPEGPSPAAPTGRRGRSPRGGRVTREMVYAILFPLNVGVMLIPQTRPDALNDEELTRLCDSIVKVAAINRHVEKAILSSVESSAYVELAIVVGAIAVKRAASHGLLPTQLGASVSGMFGLGEVATPPPESDVPEPTPNGATNVYAPGVPVA